MTSWQKPTDAQVSRAIGLLAHKAQERYFFDSLKNPLWVEPLRKEGYFKNPPAPVTDGKTIGFPPWPQSRYLARIAATTPNQKEITDVILDTDTKNVSVWEDFVQATLSLQPNLAKAILPKAIKWVDTPFTLRLPELLGKLAAHLARGGEVDPALRLAKALLELKPDPRESSGKDTEWMALEPKAKCQAHDYEDILQRDVPDLIRSAGLRALDLLCDLLEQATVFSHKKGKAKLPEDFSFIWRPALEFTERHNLRGVKDLLVSSVARACEQIVDENPGLLEEVLRYLEGRRWWIFRRLGLHLLKKYAVENPQNVVTRCLDRELFDAYWAEREYAFLLGVGFPMLSAAQQQELLEWISEGPPSVYTKRENDASRVEQMRKRWRQERLAWIGQHLPSAWKATLDTLTAELGKVSGPRGEPIVTTEWRGPTSPKTSEELDQMSAQEVVTFLKTWQWPRKTWDDSPEGLGRALSSAVSKDPQKFAEIALDFRGLDPTYVRSFLDGLEKAAKEKRCFSWGSVLALCQWIVQQPREIPGRVVREDHLEADPDWAWCRKTIARLISEGFDRDHCTLSTDVRIQVWSIILTLAEDPEPAFIDGASKPAMDFATESISTVRGEAFHAAMRYALWLRQAMDTLPDGPEHVKRGFDEMPEVRDLLEKHLEIKVDAAPAIRAVYGQWFPWLVAWDKRWTAKFASSIFPSSTSSSVQQEAAWKTYIRYCHPYDNVLEILKDQYANAVLNLQKKAREDPTDLEESLAQHILTYAWRGKLDAGLLKKFWAAASSNLREEAIEFMGRALYHTEDEVSNDIQVRFQTIWQERVDAVRASISRGEQSTELSGFSWWFASGKLDDCWALENLITALKLSGKMEGAHLVAERLEKLVTTFPIQVLEALSVLVESDRAAWSYYAWGDQAKTILTATLASLEEPVREAARRLVNRLGVLGYLEFGGLLKEV